MKVVPNLKSWFFDAFKTLPLSEVTQMYLVDVFARPNIVDIGDRSIVIAHIEATTFIDHQKIGDWSIWLSTIDQTTQHLQTIQTIGSMSYRSCYRLLGHKISLYEELANELPIITNHLRIKLNDACAT